MYMHGNTIGPDNSNSMCMFGNYPILPVSKHVHNGMKKKLE